MTLFDPNHPLWTWLLKSSFQASVLILLVLIAQWLFRRQLSPRWRYSLWLLVIVRLLMPAFPQSMLSVFNWVRPNGATVSKMTLPYAIREDNSVGAERPLLPESIQASEKTAQSESAAQAIPKEIQTSVVNDPADAPVISALPQPRSAENTFHSSGSNIRTPIKWQDVLVPIWIFGFVLLWFNVIIASIRLERRLSKCRIIDDQDTVSILEECRRQMGVKTHVTILETTAVETPAICGIWRPKVLLPPGLKESFNRNEMRFIFLHELAHVKHHDIVLNWLLIFLQNLHWFNPLIWIAFSRVRADRELVCDADAMASGGAVDNWVYGITILKLLDGFIRPTSLPGLVGIAERKSHIRLRIQMIARFKRSPYGWKMALALLGVLSLACLTDAQSPRNEGIKTSKHSLSLHTNVPPEKELRIGSDPLPKSDGKIRFSQTHSLTITVVDDTNDDPVADVDISANDGFQGANVRRLTDKTGRFLLQSSVDSIPMSSWICTLSHPNFVEMRVFQVLDFRTSVVPKRVFPKSLKIRMNKGDTIGGRVLDVRKQPLNGVGVFLEASGTTEQSRKSKDESYYVSSHYYSEDKELPSAITDAQGYWNIQHCPSDAESMKITFVRPDGAHTVFATQNRRECDDNSLSIKEVKEKTATFVLKDGVTIKGIVVDERNIPIAGALVKEGFGHRPLRKASEFMTDKNGRFVLHNRIPRQWIYTVAAKGRATTSVVLDAARDVHDLRIVVPPAKPLTIRAVDHVGRPYANARISAHYNNEAQILDWQGATDTEGLLVWTNAPLMPVRFSIVSSDFNQILNQSQARSMSFMAAGGENKVITLAPYRQGKVHIRMQARDAQTGKPVNIHFVAIERYQTETFVPLAMPNTNDFQLEILENDFSNGSGLRYRLKIEAQGYDPIVTEQTDTSEIAQTLSLDFQPKSHVSNLILLPNNQFAEGTRIWIKETIFDGGFVLNNSRTLPLTHWRKISTDEQGKFALPPATSNSPIVFIHQDGILSTTIGELKQERIAKLQTWGKVEGRLMAGGSAFAGMLVGLKTPNNPPYEVSVDYKTRSGSNGFFSFPEVPAGSHELYRIIGDNHPVTPINAFLAQSRNFSHAIPITVKPGETITLDYGGFGRSITGLATPDDKNPYKNTLWRGELIRRPTGTTGIKESDFAIIDSYQKARRSKVDFHPNAANPNVTALPENYVLAFDSLGAFHADDVPPGNYTINLYLILLEYVDSDRGPQEQTTIIGSLRQEVSIPSGEGKYQFGKIIVPTAKERLTVNR